MVKTVEEIKAVEKRFRNHISKMLELLSKDELHLIWWNLVKRYNISQLAELDQDSNLNWDDILHGLSKTPKYVRNLDKI